MEERGAEVSGFGGPSVDGWCEALAHFQRKVSEDQVDGSRMDDTR